MYRNRSHRRPIVEQDCGRTEKRAAVFMVKGSANLLLHQRA
jgi:hypothetical protein